MAELEFYTVGLSFTPASIKRYKTLVIDNLVSWLARVGRGSGFLLEISSSGNVWQPLIPYAPLGSDHTEYFARVLHRFGIKRVIRALITPRGCP